MRTIALLMLFLGSCRLATIDDTLLRVEKATEVIAQVGQAASGAAGMISAKVAELKAADVNKDGKLSLSELMAWLASGGVLGAGIYTSTKQKQIDQLYDATHVPASQTPPRRA